MNSKSRSKHSKCSLHSNSSLLSAKGRAASAWVKLLYLNNETQAKLELDKVTLQGEAAEAEAFCSAYDNAPTDNNIEKVLNQAQRYLFQLTRG